MLQETDSMCRRLEEVDSVFDQSQPGETASELVGLVALGDVAELTLGNSGSGSEDKRREYN